MAAIVFCRAAVAEDVGGWKELWTLIQHREAVPQPPAAACLEDGPPVLEESRVLFRFQAPAGVRNVSLAGDFNRWADNRKGRLTNRRYAMHPAGEGRWFRWEDLPAGRHKYIFVLEHEDGSFAWVKDPHVRESDDEGHSLLTVSGGLPAMPDRGMVMQSFLLSAARETARGPRSIPLRADKVWVRPGEGNVLRMRVPEPGTAVLTISTPTGRTVHESRHAVAAGDAAFPVPPLQAVGGYLARIEVRGPGAAEAITLGTTVLTVAKSVADDIRYAFYAAYDPRSDNVAGAESLAALHVNAVEFYDYFPAHGHYAPRNESYVFEPFGIRIAGSDVRGKIEAGHARNMHAIAYVAAYAASRSVFEKHPFPMTDATGAAKVFNGQVTTEAAADAKGEPKWFWLMNVADDSPWHRHIMGEFARALDDTPDDIVSFDGFEIDTYGDAADATFHAAQSRRDGDPLVEVLHDFVGDVRGLARRVKPGAVVSFNSVNEFGAERMSDVTDFAFLEIWRHHTPWLRDLVDICHRYRGPGRQRVVLKLYPADMEPKQTAWPPGSLAMVLGAAMTGGGSLMVVGQPDTASGTMHGLNTLFYPDNTPLVSGNEELVRAYYRHDALLFGYTHGPDVYNTGIEATAAGCMTRTYAAPSQAALVVQLLRRSGDGRWSTPSNLPEPVENLTVSIPRLTAAVPREVFYASPDREQLAVPSGVDFSVDAENIVVRLPALAVHGTVVLQY